MDGDAGPIARAQRHGPPHRHDLPVPFVREDDVRLGVILGQRALASALRRRALLVDGGELEGRDRHVAPQTDPDPKASHSEWQIYHGDYAGSHYSELDQINRSNVQQLEVAWTWNSGDSGFGIETNPIIVDGVVFVTTAALHVAALNAKTGELIWRFNPWGEEEGRGINRGVHLVIKLTLLLKVHEFCKFSKVS
jgi:glucose dehydrogenase